MFFSIPHFARSVNTSIQIRQHNGVLGSDYRSTVICNFFLTLSGLASNFTFHELRPIFLVWQKLKWQKNSICLCETLFAISIGNFLPFEVLPAMSTFLGLTARGFPNSNWYFFLICELVFFARVEKLASLWKDIFSKNVVETIIKCIF